MTKQGIGNPNKKTQFNTIAFPLFMSHQKQLFILYLLTQKLFS